MDINDRLYQDPVTFGIIEELRDAPGKASFKLKHNLRLVFGDGIVERAEFNPFGAFRTTISADEALEQLYEAGELLAFCSGADTLLNP